MMPPCSEWPLWKDSKININSRIWLSTQCLPTAVMQPLCHFLSHLSSLDPQNFLLRKHFSASSSGWVQSCCLHHACQRDLKSQSFLGLCARSLYSSHRHPALKIQVPIHPIFLVANSAMALIRRVFGEPCKELAFVMAGGCKKIVAMCPSCRLSAALSKLKCCRLPEIIDGEYGIQIAQLSRTSFSTKSYLNINIFSDQEAGWGRRSWKGS